MFFNRLNTNTNAHRISDTVCYVHKKFGIIRSNTTKFKKQDGLTNEPKRFKVEALKSKASDTNGPGKKAIFVGTKTENKIKNKPLDMPDLSSPSLTSRQSNVKRTEPLKRPVLDYVYAKPLHPMVEPRNKRIEPLKGPCRPAPLTLQQQQLRGPSVLGKYLDDISAMPPKALQPMIEPCIKRIEPLKGPFRPVPLPLQQQQQLRGLPMLGNYLDDTSAMLPKPLKEPFRPVPLPFQQQLKEPFRSVLVQLHQQQISVLEKQLEDIAKTYYEKFMCKIPNSEPNMTIRHLPNTTLRSANKENLIKKTKKKYVESDSKKQMQRKL